MLYWQDVVWVVVVVLTVCGLRAEAFGIATASAAPLTAIPAAANVVIFLFTDPSRSAF